MSTTSRAAAGRWTRLSQYALAACVGSGVVLAAAGLPGMTTPEAPGTLTIPTVTISELTPRQDPSRTPINLWAVSDRLAAVTNHPKPAEVVVVAPGGAQPPPPPPPPEPEIRYLGIARMGPLTRALINDNGRQRFVRVGDTVSMGLVLTIEAEYIEVGPEGATGEARRRIDLAARAMALFRAAAEQQAADASANANPANPAKVLVKPGDMKLGAGAEVPTTISGVNPRSSKFRTRPPGANQPTPPPRPGFKPTIQETLAERKRRDDIKAMLKSNGATFKSEQELIDAAEKIFAEEQEARRREKE
jgi:hypothetical protein